jgi:hypothetical protein
MYIRKCVLPMAVIETVDEMLEWKKRVYGKTQFFIAVI